MLKIRAFCLMCALAGCLTSAGCNSATSEPVAMATVPTKKPEVLSISKEPTAQEAKTQLRKTLQEQIPLGSTRARLGTWLKTTKNDTWDAEGKEIGRRYESVLKSKNYKLTDLSLLSKTVIELKVQDKSFLAILLFFFDENGKLIESDIASIGSVELKQVSGKPNLKEVKQMVNKGISLGLTSNQITAWLDSKKIKHNSYTQRKDYLENSSSVRRSKHRVENLGGVIQAVIPKNSKAFTRYTDITMIFFFDKNSKLIDYSVDEVGTGL